MWEIKLNMLHKSHTLCVRVCGDKCVNAFCISSVCSGIVMFVGEIDGGACSHIACELVSMNIVTLDFGTEPLKTISY